jgi:two-component system capsular synthesis sensor histidine kinase RcsC
VHVLIAEDEILLRLVYEEFVADLGHKVLVAIDGLEALELLRAGPVDVLVTDLNMPRMDGHELLAVVAVEFPALLVIVASAYAKKMTMRDLGATGIRVHHHLVKPFDLTLLAKLLAEAERGLAP